MFRADEHFVLTASIHHVFASKWDGGALVIKTDSLNWIKFCFEKDYTGARRIVSVATNNISDDANHVAFSKNAAWFKVAKADNVITLYVSNDGKNWLLVRHLQFNSSQRPFVGFLAQSPTGDNCRVTFSNIRYQPVKIKDPYAGE
jgi:regulation of enolase protein 1 (concanavalin A-like superfamily)